PRIQGWAAPRPAARRSPRACGPLRVEFPLASATPLTPYSRPLLMLSIGDLVLDITIVPETRLRVDDDNPAQISVGGGGQAANFCAWAAHLGEPARLVTRVGDDEGGRLLVAELEAAGVDVRPVWATQPTGAIAGLLGPKGERTVATERGAGCGAAPYLPPEQWE